MDTAKMREEAGVLLAQAENALGEGDTEKFTKIADDARGVMDKADGIDAAAKQLNALKGDFRQPAQSVPIASRDVAAYDAEDTGARNKSSYKPSSWVKGLPAAAQPIWVQEQMGVTEKEHARFQSDTFVKWMRSPSDDVFWKTATIDEVKAMQEETDAEGLKVSALVG